jgi:hypothetical protein
MAREDLEALLRRYQLERRVSREEAVRMVRADLGEPPGPSRQTQEKMAQGELAWSARAKASREAARTRGRAPPSPAAVVSRVAEVLPQPPITPPVGAYFARIYPGGRIDPQGWRPPGVTPVKFYEGYWTRKAGDTLTLYRSGEPVNEWNVASGQELSQALNDLTEFVKRWPIMAERSVRTVRR